jgi:hypothetical protein
MKVNPINILRNTGMAALAAGMLSACNYTPDKTKEYFADKSVLEYQEFVDNCNNKQFDKTQAQAKLDSLAYREIFNATEATKDFQIVKEFNNIANMGLRNKAEKNLASTGISLNEYNKILKTSTERGGYLNSQKFTDQAKVQHRADSILYRRFFEKHGLLNSENLAKFEKLTEKIRPD